MQISKSIINDTKRCFSGADFPCEKCKAGKEWNHFVLCDLILFLNAERIWYCPTCVMIGNHEEFTQKGNDYICNRCKTTVVEEITLEK